jgi:mono/diheme cytochrome c family protein
MMNIIEEITSEVQIFSSRPLSTPCVLRFARGFMRDYKLRSPRRRESMRKGWGFTALTLGLLLFLMAPPSGRGAKSDTAPNVPKGWVFGLPAGNAADGKTVFVRMECYACHTLSRPGLKLPADAGGTGPDLTGYTAVSREYLAESIIKSHKVVAVRGYVVKEGQAGMGKYNHFLTIQELVDLVAFLKRGK